MFGLRYAKQWLKEFFIGILKFMDYNEVGFSPSHNCEKEKN